MNEEEKIKELEEELVEVINDYNEEKEKNKKLEEEYAKAIESEADIAVSSHKLINNLAQAIRFMSTNEKLTVEDIIKEFSKENEVTEEFMERWEKSKHEESHLKDKVIDLMSEDLLRLDFKSEEDVKKYSTEVKEMYFKKARGEENEQL